MAIKENSNQTPLTSFLGLAIKDDIRCDEARLQNNEEISPATRKATTGQRWTALFICIAIAFGTALFFPIAEQQWPRFPGFLPTYQTTIIFSYFVTSYLIYSHYRATRTPALLYLGAGCFYTAAILVVQFLSFPGMVIAQVPLVGAAQTTIWLWCFWHAGPAVGIFLYALSGRRRSGQCGQEGKNTAIRFGAGLMLALVVSIALVTVFHDWLPVLDNNGDFSNITSLGIAPAIQAMTVTAFLLLWWTTRFRTVLHVWLGVALFALLFDNAITMMGGTRLSVGWYIGRLNALISATVMLVIYLREFKWVYFRTVENAKQLAVANALLKSEIDERLRQEEALRRSEALLRQLGEHQDTLKEEERKRVAREIHDELGQNMLALRMDVSLLHQRLAVSNPDLAENARLALGYIDTTVKSVRSIMNNLRPAVLDLGLLAAIEWQISQFMRLSGMTCDLRADEQQLEQLPIADKNMTAIFRALQESLTNVLRHASATHVVVEVRSDSGFLAISIKDNGRGFEPHGGTVEGFGLVGITERITRLGGEVNIDSEPGKGTLLAIRIPLDERAVTA